MRQKEELYLLFDKIVLENEDIRLSVLEGSRTNSNIPEDNFQDYDLSFFVTDIQKYTKHEDWLKVFGGEIIAMQKPEDMELFPSECENYYSYLMYFDDGIKLDLTIIPITFVDEYFSAADGLNKILIDKDNLAPANLHPSDRLYWIKRPSARSYDDCCNEFWHVSTYIAKAFARKEILYALHLFNQISRPELLRMMSWEIGIRCGFDFSLGKNYKFIDRYITPATFDNLMKTFSLDGYEKARNAFEQCCEMFRTYSKLIADKLGFDYPIYDKNLTAFSRKYYT
ncbi:aminoglycoside 6-adenylyltransferase [Olivibacter sp. SDN3]|uniref:aminoglycoside 6-adenylyltransferase n=1 Tax=Olivibacter sp. SDN3 TaxID=2764720 RepID=UPI0016517462|nr:aminoglycoside 6-adenylyltransferase [Olivibacter sp. SDN3]QNL51087.1 aminoglycoside 6-adenylyltransferase [Olivibacter sp. SDN3]